MAPRPLRLPRTRRALLLWLLRWGLPGAVVLAGLIVVAVDPTIDGLEGAAHIIGAGLAIWLLNLLVRIGISGDRDRRAEDDARAYFSRHGHWPDEAPLPAPPSAEPVPHPSAAARHRPAPSRTPARPRLRGPR